MTTLKAFALALPLALPLNCASLSARAADTIVRHDVPHFPIASSVEVPGGYSTIYVSGMGADPINKSGGKMPTSIEAYGDTETQARSALKKIQATLEGLHLGMADVVRMNVYVVADPKLGHMDFAGLNKAYKEFYGTASQPVLPARAAIQIAALANPGWLVEIEVTAVRKPG